VTGATDPTQPLQIVPSADEQTEHASFPWGVAPVFFIGSMPATRTINAVTLGDVARNPDCGWREYVPLDLSIVEIPSGQYSGPGTTVATAEVVVPGDWDFHRFTWRFPEVQLVAGRAYELVMENDDWYGCAGITWHRWAHNSNVVNAGPGMCSQFEATTYYPEYRYWHVQGQNDVNPYCPYGYDLTPDYFDSAMPTGWLETYRYSSWDPFIYMNTQQTYGQHCPAQGSGSWNEARPYTGGDGASHVACEFTGFTAPGATTPDGWYFSLPWGTGVPRDLWVQLDDVGGSGSGGVQPPATPPAITTEPPSPSSTAGGSNPGATNLRPCVLGDPVDCATGNFYENTTDLSVAGRGVPLGFARTYNALNAGSTDPGPLGPGWSSSFSAHLEFQTNIDRVVVHNDNGSIVTFQRNSDGGYSAPAFATASLVKNADGSYVYTLKNHVAYRFDQNGLLQAVTDGNGYQTTVSYTGGKIDHVTDPEGRALRFAYDSDGHLQTVTDPHSRTVSFSYDPAGTLATATDVASNTTEYAYNAAHLLTAMQDPRGGVTTNVYDSQGRVVSQTDPAGATTAFAYATTGTNGNSGRTTITDPRGHVTTEQFTDGEMTSKTVAIGTSQEAAWTYDYDDHHSLSSSTAPDGARTEYAYDDAGNLTSKADGAGRTTFTYTSLNDPKTITDPAGEVTTFAYDTHGNLTGISRPLAGSSDLAHSDYTYDPNHPGDLVTSTNPVGQTTKYAYDANGDVSIITDPAGDVTTYAYTDIGWLQSAVSPRGNATGANPDNYCTTLERNAYGDVTKLTDPLGHQTTIGYDRDGNRTSVTDPDGQITRTAYDPDNRPITVTRPDGSTISTAYNETGNVAQVTDGLGHKTLYDYSPRDELTKITDPLGAATRFDYDLTGRRTVKINARGQTTHYGYDLANRLTGITYNDPVTPDVTFAYDADSRRTQMTDGTGTTSWAYDSLGRLTSQTGPVGGVFGGVNLGGISGSLGIGGASQTTKYSYDLANALTRIDYSDNQTVATAFGGAPTVLRHYDAAGRLTSVSDWLQQTSSFKYDPDGHLAEVDYPDGTKAALAYDHAGRQVRTTDTGPYGTFLDIPYGRDNAGLITSTGAIGLTSTATETLSYDRDQRLTGETADTPAALSRNAYTYDDGDRLTTLSILGVPLNNTYDNADELTRTIEPNTQNSTATYAYDPDGNRASQTGPASLTVNYSYDQADRLIRYRNNGQNAANGLLPTTATQSATDTTYKYTGDGLRADMLWDRTQPTPAILADATNIYIDGPGGLPIEQVAPGGTITYYHADQLGSTRALTDKNGRTLALYNYDPYGNRATAKATSAVAPFGYAGQYTDATSGLIYMRARWYDPQTAQFLTRDPSGFLGGQNPYGYTAGDPVNLNDPSGLAGCDPALAFETGLGEILSQDALAVSIAAAQATARAASSGSIAGAELAIAEFEAEDGIAMDEATYAIRAGWPRMAGGAEGLTQGQEMGILREALTGTGDYGLGSATAADADKLGTDFVGQGYTHSESNPDILVSADGLRQYRPPSFKPSLGIYQGNFERRFAPTGEWQGNGHLDIIDLP
jgi:RHS repeat-associated protein